MLGILNSCGEKSPEEGKGAVVKEMGGNFNPEFSERTYGGTLDSKIPISMVLNRKGKAISGTYQMNTLSVDIYLNGEVRGDSVFLTETSSQGAITGYFSAAYLRNGEEISGRWESNSRADKRPFTVFAKNR
ncbi:MAG: hypothetical protein H6581_29210 [Bacteroidia bacterium]|nr:hypothetical protein [Bacteroidia bacterium]